MSLDTFESKTLIRYFQLPTNKDNVVYMAQTELKEYLEEKTNAIIESRALTDALQYMGFQRKGKRIDGKPKYVYVLAKREELPTISKQEEKDKGSDYWKIKSKNLEAELIIQSSKLKRANDNLAESEQLIDKLKKQIKELEKLIKE